MNEEQYILGANAVKAMADLYAKLSQLIAENRFEEADKVMNMICKHIHASAVGQFASAQQAS